MVDLSWRRTEILPKNTRNAHENTSKLSNIQTVLEASLNEPTTDELDDEEYLVKKGQPFGP